jgi:hypothetical protein
MPFSFPHRSPSRSMPIRQALAQPPLGSAAAAVPLTILERPGSYAGRHVTFFRVFDPARAASAGIHPRAFGDLDAHPELIAGSGHVERDGLVVLTRRPEQDDAAAAPSRQPADRTAHLDDERFVFWDTRKAGASTLVLSQPAAAWLHTQSAAEGKRTAP